MLIVEQKTANAIMDALADDLEVKVSNINGEVLAVGKLQKVLKNAIRVDDKTFFYKDKINVERI